MTASTSNFQGALNDIGTRFVSLGAAINAAEGRINEADLAAARELEARAGDRLRLSGEHTIVALGGATGSGKSSLFNQLTDLELAGVGVRRPTTSWALACAWGPDGAQELLNWMGIPPRHQVSRMSMLDKSAEDQKLDGLVLLDLPDHDSTEVAHHVEMDRLVRYSDVLVWVLDPQKYADAALHDRYIKPMAEYADVTIVVLNQIDRIHYEQRDKALQDVRRILADEGLGDATVLGVSATRGDGIDELKRELARRIRAKKSARERLRTDLQAVVSELAAVGGSADVPGIGPVDEEALDVALLEAAGAQQLVNAVEASSRRRALKYTSWLPLRWYAKRQQPSLAELGLNDQLLPELAGDGPRVQRSRVENALRDIAERASVGLERPWRDAVRDASLMESDEVASELDQAVANSDAALTGTPLWWRIAGLLQWLGLLAIVGGVAWGIAVVAGVTETHTQVGGVDAPWALAIAGLALGIVVASLGRIVSFFASRRRASKVDTHMCEAVVRVGRSRVLEPIENELDRYSTFRSNLLSALS